MNIATFAAGCFWGVEAAFLKVDGVLETKVGYTGGSSENPTYKEVCTGETGHAEAVQIKYDPEKIEFEQLLNIFFFSHDPTQVNRQGPDIGTQYRSSIFFHDQSQKEVATKYVESLNQRDEFKSPIATEIVEVAKFWDAEEYHQRYFEKNGINVCQN